MIPKSLSNNSKILIIQLNFKPSSFFTIHREVYDFQFIFKKGITIQLLIEMIYRFIGFRMLSHKTLPICLQFICLFKICYGNRF